MLREEEYMNALTEWQRIKALQIAELLADADRAKEDPRSSRRQWTGLLKLAGNGEVRLRAAVASREAAGDPLAELLMQHAD